MTSQIRLSCIFFISIIANSYHLKGGSLIDFKKISIEESKTFDKKILVSFSAGWCLPCNIMDESIFADQEIADFINDNFIAVKADIETDLGKSWQDLYLSHYLPTNLFTLNNGSEIKRVVGVPSRNDFLNLLYEIAEVDEITIAQQIAKPQPSPPITNPIEQPSTYAIQVGAFASRDNAHRTLAIFNEKDMYNVIISEHLKNDGQLLHRVLLNGYQNRSEANQVLHRIKEEGLDGFVRESKNEYNAWE